ncbi:hypothetical protein QO190_02315 [Cloacibacterium sp. Arc13]|uniref:hypothetical protein n=1 Tax=unclassified Cloacibacterium TaxID=2620870 RepID=UPI00352EE407
MKRLNYYLGIVVLLIITIVSCRNEIFTEKTEQIDPNAILFKSNVVSLSQSKHRNKLLPEISATKKKLSNAKYKTSNGKIINFGDISLDTDHVVYIENGQNYHNYIFKITRENGTENLPLENILFTPLPDGSYKEFLISYNITQQERQALEQGIWRVPKERITINEIKKGTYSNTIFQKTSSETCNWVAVDTYTFCSANVHFHGEGYPDCTAEIKSQLVTTFVLKCESVDDGSSTSGGGTSSGGTWEGGTGDTDGTQDGGTDGSGGGTSPCSGTGIYTQPQDPSYSTGDCEDGVPLLPNLGIGSPHATPTPCEKIVTENTKLKSITDKELFISNKNTITANINTDTNEKSFSYGVDSNNVFKTTPIKESTTGNSVGIDVTYTGLTVQGGTHTHYKNLYASFSIRDFYLFKNSNASNSNFKNYFAFGADGHTYALSITDEEKFNNFLTNYPLSTFYDATNDEWNANENIGQDYKLAYKQFMNDGKTDDEADALAQALVLNKYGAGMSISRQESDGTFKGLFINETKVPMNVGGIFINVSVFTQIDNCNL